MGSAAEKLDALLTQAAFNAGRFMHDAGAFKDRLTGGLSPARIVHKVYSALPMSDEELLDKNASKAQVEAFRGFMHTIAWQVGCTVEIDSDLVSSNQLFDISLYPDQTMMETQVLQIRPGVNQTRTQNFVSALRDMQTLLTFPEIVEGVRPHKLPYPVFDHLLLETKDNLGRIIEERQGRAA
jgi:hypothetical protein